ncbi:MAG: bifunctional glutamate N-acetyltransferase/amino-acid acetyltransferase ArgJ [Nitrospirae bacterium]|nr:bifunctional glutamate N-acetyltransferase/amino-acid acetyltransferase ArgJ [Nitrospirota bacterium]
MKIVRGGITSAKGFIATGVSCGIKKDSRLDLALIFSEKVSAAAGLFTTNRFIAPPLILTKKNLKKGTGQAVIVNSGNANAATGSRGYEDALEMGALTAKELGIDSSLVSVASTGVIGEPLPMEKIRSGIPLVVNGLRKNGGKDAARAIMTTDTFFKEAAVKGIVGGREVSVGGIAKGSGMIHPNMATMLAFIGTDATISGGLLKKSLRKASDLSFNMITVDGETSTNDMVLCLANGMSGAREIREGSRELKEFQSLLEYVCLALAKMIVRDGEGATKFVTITVDNARNFKDAKKIAMSVGRSLLVKTAFFGEDANWGRFMAAIGYSGVKVDEGEVDIYYDGVKIVNSGTGTGSKADLMASKVLKKKEFSVRIDLKAGKEKATVWTTDLSYDYVRINASYRS